MTYVVVIGLVVVVVVVGVVVVVVAGVVVVVVVVVVVLVVVHVELLLGLGMALLFASGLPARRWLLAAVLAPYAVSEVSAAVIWRFLFDADVGPVTVALHALGLPSVPTVKAMITVLPMRACRPPSGTG